MDGHEEEVEFTYFIKDRLNKYIDIAVDVVSRDERVILAFYVDMKQINKIMKELGITPMLSCEIVLKLNKEIKNELLSELSSKLNEIFEEVINSYENQKEPHLPEKRSIRHQLMNAFNDVKVKEAFVNSFCSAFSRVLSKKHELRNISEEALTSRLIKELLKELYDNSSSPLILVSGKVSELEPFVQIVLNQESKNLFIESQAHENSKLRKALETLKTPFQKVPKLKN